MLEKILEENDHVVVFFCTYLYFFLVFSSFKTNLSLYILTTLKLSLALLNMEHRTLKIILCLSNNAYQMLLAICDGVISHQHQCCLPCCSKARHLLCIVTKIIFAPFKPYLLFSFRFPSSIADKEGDKKSQKILSELENIDDECEEKDIDFVKTSDDGVQKEYDLSELPALAFYRHKFRTIYDGDLMHEEAILSWVLDLHDSQPDIIESVDRKTLKDLITDVEHLAVFFCK